MPATTTEPDGAREGPAGRGAEIGAPELAVVSEPPPEPDCLRYRIRPGSRVCLAELNPDEHEHYAGKKDAEAELNRPRDRISELQARLYAEDAGAC